MAEEQPTPSEEVLAALEAAEAERQRYRELFELAPDAYLVTDARGRIAEANRAAAQQLGVSAQELAGTEVAAYAAPAERAELTARLAGLVGPAGWEVRFHPPGRRPFEASVRVAPARAHGEAGGDLRWLIHDITERRRAEDALRLLADAGRVLSESLELPVMLGGAADFAARRFAEWCLIDLVEDGGFERVAVAHADPALRHVAEEMQRIGRRWDDGTPGSEALRTGRPVLIGRWTEERTAGLADPRLHAMADRVPTHSMLAVPLAARGEILGVWTFARSDPDRPFDEQDVPVAEELGRRAAQSVINARLYRTSERAGAAKDRFLATLSHELRTPLTPVLARVSALQGDERLSTELRADLAMMRRNVELEARLIDDLLDLTRVTRGKLEVRPEVTDLAALIEHALHICSAEAVAAGRLTVVKAFEAKDHRLWGDPSRLTQVFWNLLHNAVKFTPEGGTITVRTWRDERSGELVVEIHDTGIGFEPGAGEQLFRPFEQAGRRITRRYGGLGLGLALSQAIVELHGGRIEAASPGPDRGATFTVHLPALEVEAGAEASGSLAGAEPAAPAPPAVEGRQLHILLVEDHADTAEAMASLLSASGYRVTIAHSLAEARLAAGREPAPDLLVSDLGLPDGTGFDLMTELVARQPLPGIALSGYGMEEDVRKSREAGFAAHLTKPVTMDTLLAAIRRAVGSA